jgi:hypothetical protein
MACKQKTSLQTFQWLIDIKVYFYADCEMTCNMEILNLSEYNTGSC